jgi:hypothetical protein
MPELGFVVYLIAFSYALGVLWYTLLGYHYTNWARMAAFPLVGVIIGAAVWDKYLAEAIGPGLVFLDLNIYVALVSTFVAILVDMAFSWLSREYHVADFIKSFEPTHQPTQR